MSFTSKVSSKQFMIVDTFATELRKTTSLTGGPNPVHVNLSLEARVALLRFYDDNGRMLQRLKAQDVTIMELQNANSKLGELAADKTGGAFDIAFNLGPTDTLDVTYAGKTVKLRRA